MKSKNEVTVTESRENMKTRQTLLLKLRDRFDDGSWEEFAKIYKPYIQAVIRNIGVLDADVDDVSQQVMLAAWNQLPKFKYEESKGRFRSWLTAVTKNTAKNFFRHKFRHVDRIKEQISTGGADELARVTSPEIDEIAQKEWEKYITDLAWERIEDRFQPHVKQAFLMISEGESVQETSETLNLSADTVYVYKYRVQKAFLREINFLDEELG